MKPKKNQPRFKIGDIVVITMYGTVGTITKMHLLDHQFVYEVNHSDILYYENTLQLYVDYEGTIIDTEKVNISMQFQIGDIVLVKEYGKSLFKIVGVRTEIWRYEEDGWEEVTYELTRMADGEWLEADEDEMSLMISNHEAESFMQQFYLSKFSQTDTIDEPEILFDEQVPFNTHMITSNIGIIDELLDIYNDYMTLYQMFNDQEYLDMMKLAMKSLKRYNK